MTMTTPARKLASIQKVNAVEPIPGADAIEKIRVLGWWVVVKKGEFQPGDPVVYCEIDSLMPDRPEFEFLRERSNMRIKTARLRGQVSQGICFPLSILPGGEHDVWVEGDDVTELLGVVKYEKPQKADSSTQPLAPLPGFIPKTDEIRVQNLEALLERHRGLTVVSTEKVDGSSMTVFVREGEFGVCSRNCHLEDVPGCKFWGLAKRDDLEGKLRKWIADHGGEEIAVQGELVGPGIQGNKLRLKEHAFLVFNVYSLTSGEYLCRRDFRWVVEDLGLTGVPELGQFRLDHTIDQLVELATGKSVLAPEVEREGIVIRPLVEMTDPDVGRLSFKAINPRFLLKFDE